jgi:hypothetical protein
MVVMNKAASNLKSFVLCCQHHEACLFHKFHICKRDFLVCSVQSSCWQVLTCLRHLHTNLCVRAIWARIPEEINDGRELRLLIHRRRLPPSEALS